MNSSTLVIGFIPLLDCAPLVVAAEKGFAAAEGVDLSLVRETSWANIRDRLIVGHFDAAHMLGPMAVASSLGIGHLTVPIVAPLSLGLGGNAITMSNLVWQQMLLEGARIGADPHTQGTALNKVIRTRARSNLAPLTFAMVYPFSCHHYELRYWLAACDVDPDRDVRLVVMPPPFMVDALREGQIDGFCVGEPWNSLAVDAGAGAIVTSASQVWRLCPEKVLGCRADWAEAHPRQLASLVRAIQRASEWCEDAGNHAELAKLLSEPRYVGVPAAVLMRGLSQQLKLSTSAEPVPVDDFYVLARQAATFPWSSHALWFYMQMVRWGQVRFSNEHLARVQSTYRPDLYRSAVASMNINAPMDDMKVEGAFTQAGQLSGISGPIAYGPDGFFDHRPFDPHALTQAPNSVVKPFVSRRRV